MLNRKNREADGKLGSDSKLIEYTFALKDLVQENPSTDIQTNPKLIETHLHLYDSQLFLLARQKKRLLVGTVNYKQSTVGALKAAIGCGELIQFDDEGMTIKGVNDLANLHYPQTRFADSLSNTRDIFIVGDRFVTNALSSCSFYTGASFIKHEGASTSNPCATMGDVSALAHAIAQDNFLESLGEDR